MAAKPKQNPDLEEETEKAENDAKQRGIWVDSVRWEKLKLIKNELGDWHKFADVAIEQLLASGLISKETREAIYAINRANGLDFLDDTAWRDTFEIREPWAKTATHIRKIDEGVAELNGNLKELAQAVEDHAMAMLEGELVKSDDTED